MCRHWCNVAEGLSLDQHSCDNVRIIFAFLEVYLNCCNQQGVFLILTDGLSKQFFLVTLPKLISPDHEREVTSERTVW